MKIHIVQKGDTLWKIAKKYGVNFEELKKLNSQLSNPDMIMPGMKVKIPSTGGTIKKEVPMGKPEMHLGVKKEMPITKEVPIAKEVPIKEAPIKEVPIKEVPIKEVPIKEVPIAKEVPIKEKPIIKEMPKVPYTPKQPIAVVPEKDISNYYISNMTNMTPKLPEKPANILPEVKEVPKKEIPFVQPVEQCVPVTPILPGPGFCPPFMPYPGQGFPAAGCMPEMPYVAAPMSNAVPNMLPNAVPNVMPNVAPNVAGTPYHFTDESSSFMPQMPMMNPGAVMGAQNPGMPYMAPSAQYPAGGYEQMPMGYPATPMGYPETGAGYPVGATGYPVGTGYPDGVGYPAQPAGYPGGFDPAMAGQYGMGMPYGQMPMGTGSPGPQVMGAAYGAPEMMMPGAGMAMPYMQPSYPMQGFPAGVGGMGDCGCGPVPMQMPMQMPMAEPISNALPNNMPNMPNVPSAAPQSFVPPTPPIYSAPYTGAPTEAQPPFMNPYGMGPGGAYGMPRYVDESND